MRNAAKAMVDTLLQLLPAAQRSELANHKRYTEEFAGPEEKDLGDKPADFLETFDGNTDDCFRMGIALLRKTTKLYAPFYKSDIIVASPLGLKLIIGDEGFVPMRLLANVYAVFVALLIACL
jgi:U3 small nucleolar RNA-associated protein 25